MKDLSVQTQMIKGHHVEFYPLDHIYKVDGIIVPSVTQIIKELLPSPYKNVDKIVLKRAADRGVALHKEIELFETKGLRGKSEEFNNYLRIKALYDLKTIENEQMIIIEHNYEIICAGRLDMIIKSKFDLGYGIGDIKRTYQIHMEHLKFQLNLYALGYEQSYNQKITYLKCIHLRKSVSNFIDIELDQAYTLDMINAFIKNR